VFDGRGDDDMFTTPEDVHSVQEFTTTVLSERSRSKHTMNLDELRSVQSTERKKDSLQNLRPSFYQEVGEYIADLEAERDQVASAADDPFSSPEVGRLTDEIETARDVVEAVYERRMGKLVKQASLAAAGMQADDEGLTAEEQDLFVDLVDRIQANKGRVLDTLEGVDEPNGDSTAQTAGAGESDLPSTRTESTATDQTPAESGEQPTATDTPPSEPEVPPAPPDEPHPDQSAADTSGPIAESGVTPADVMGGEPTTDVIGSGPSPSASDSDSETGGEPRASERDLPASDADERGPTAADDGDADHDVDRVTVRITQDVGSILGVDDREYTLSSDDVVTLPEQNATPLVEQEAAEPLE